MFERYNKISKDKVEKAHRADFLVPTTTLDDWPKIKGYNFNRKFNFQDFIKSYGSTGFQATNFYLAVEIFKEMIKEKATIMLGFTSNMASCGVREIIAYLAKEKIVDILVTTAGGVEEDIIKSLKPFVLGSYEALGKNLREKGINRTGNIFIPNDRYILFERLFNTFLEKIYKEQKKTGNISNSLDFVYKLGKEFKDENSITHWASKNEIPFICLPITDGSMGDLIYFFKQKHPDFKLDITDDIVSIVNIALNAEKTGVISLGGSVPKHQVVNANLFREGADYAIYINTGHESEGSNAAANVEEAKSWGKIKHNAKTVKVSGEASILFPLLVAGTLAKQ